MSISGPLFKPKITGDKPRSCHLALPVMALRREEERGKKVLEL